MLSTLHGEFALIERLAGTIRAAKADRRPGLRLGIGDDAALYRIAPGRALAVSTDTMVEAVHFEFDYTSATDLGHKALATNLSDLAAMGAKPLLAFVALAKPRVVASRFVEELYGGLGKLAAAHKVAVAGGDLTNSPDTLKITVTVIGEVDDKRAVTRKGAKPGEGIWVSGTLGDAALGLDAARRAGNADAVEKAHAPLLRALNRPEPRVALGQALARAGAASAMIDISDGLLGDLGHIARASRIGAEVWLKSLPRSSAYRRYVKRVGGDPWLPALSGGDDYQLLFCAPDSAAMRRIARRFSCTCIGRTLPGKHGMRVLDREQGQPQTYALRGYEHFSA